MTIVKKRKMQFYRHTNRAGNLATTILQGAVDGKRGRGRPRTTWLKNIVDWTGLANNDLHPLLYGSSEVEKDDRCCGSWRPHDRDGHGIEEGIY